MSGQEVTFATKKGFIDLLTAIMKEQLNLKGANFFTAMIYDCCAKLYKIGYKASKDWWDAFQGDHFLEGVLIFFDNTQRLVKDFSFQILVAEWVRLWFSLSDSE